MLLARYCKATTCANLFAGTLSGPHSRDYDSLLGHGMLFIEMYLHGLPGMQPLQCEYRDPHCEGTVDSARVGTFEPMTVVALSLYNVLHPNGYKFVFPLAKTMLNIHTWVAHSGVIGVSKCVVVSVLLTVAW